MIENLELIGTGFAVVMSVLAAIWGSCALVGSFFIRAAAASESAAAKAAARSATAASPAAAQPDSGGVPPHHLAVITAAVAQTLGAGHRVTRVAAPAHLVSNWPLEGRMATFSSRRARKDWGTTQPALGGKTPNILRGQKQ